MAIRLVEQRPLSEEEKVKAQKEAEALAIVIDTGNWRALWEREEVVLHVLG